MTKKTLCSRCEKLKGFCSKKNESPWCCTDRIKAFGVIEPFIVSMIDELFGQGILKDESWFAEDRYKQRDLKGNMTNYILDKFEKQGASLYGRGIEAHWFLPTWMFEEKLAWEEKLAKNHMVISKEEGVEEEKTQ